MKKEFKHHEVENKTWIVLLRLLLFTFKDGLDALYLNFLHCEDCSNTASDTTCERTQSKVQLVSNFLKPSMSDDRIQLWVAPTQKHVNPKFTPDGFT